jgi:hypothetical protein
VLAILKQLIVIATLIKEMSGKIASVNYSVLGINKEMLWAGSYDIDHINEELLSCLNLK